MVKRKSVALIMTIFIMVTLLILAGSFLSKAINENVLTTRYINSVRAFWLAEAGISEAVRNLPSSVARCIAGDACPGGYTCCYAANAALMAGSSTYYQITATGSIATGGATINRTIHSVVRVNPPNPSNFQHAIETTGNLITKGNAYTINGTRNELAALNFANLFEYSKDNVEAYAASCSTRYVDTIPAAISGVTWIEVSGMSKITIAGNLTGSGILIIEGNIHFAGTVDFDGIVYVVGTLRMSGTPTINGTILAESGVGIDTTISGHVTINYDTTAIANALQRLQFLSPERISWREQQQI